MGRVCDVRKADRSKPAQTPRVEADRLQLILKKTFGEQYEIVRFLFVFFVLVQCFRVNFMT